MLKDTVVVIHGDSFAFKELITALRETGYCVLRGDIRSEDVGVPLHLTFDINAVIVDIDSFAPELLSDLIRRINTRIEPSRIILVGSYGRKQEAELIAPENTIVFRPPLDSRTLFRLLEIERPPLKERERRHRRLVRRIESVMTSLGYARIMKGYSATAEAVYYMVLRKRRILSLASEVYPIVAERLSATPASVERAIRDSIGEVWRAMPDGMHRLLISDPLEANSPQPTNKSFLFALSDAVKKAYYSIDVPKEKSSEEGS